MLPQETLVENEKFKIVKILKGELELNSFVWDKKPLTEMEEEILKGVTDASDSVLECIVDTPMGFFPHQLHPTTPQHRTNPFEEDNLSLIGFTKRTKTEVQIDLVAQSKAETLGNLLDSSDLNTV